MGPGRSSSARSCPPLLWGVAFANIVRGVPIDADNEYIGSFFDLLNPYAPARRADHPALFLTHGAMFVALKTDGEIRQRARGPRHRPWAWSPRCWRVVLLVLAQA